MEEAKNLTLLSSEPKLSNLKTLKIRIYSLLNSNPSCNIIKKQLKSHSPIFKSQELSLQAQVSVTYLWR